MLVVILLTKFVMPGIATVNPDDVDALNPSVEIDNAPDVLLVAAVPVSV